MVITITKTMRGNAIDAPPPLRPRGSIGKGLRKEPLPCYDCTTVMTKKRRHDDTSVSLHPLSFREALKELTETPPEKPSRQTKSAAI